MFNKAPKTKCKDCEYWDMKRTGRTKDEKTGDYCLFYRCRVCGSKWKWTSNPKIKDGKWHRV
jgi:hypothetical protein